MGFNWQFFWQFFGFSEERQPRSAKQQLKEMSAVHQRAAPLTQIETIACLTILIQLQHIQSKWG